MKVAKAEAGAVAKSASNVPRIAVKSTGVLSQSDKGQTSLKQVAVGISYKRSYTIVYNFPGK